VEIFSEISPAVFHADSRSCQSIGFTIGLVMVSSNIGSYSKRIVTSSCIFIAYCVGNIGELISVFSEISEDGANPPVGPMTALAEEAPRYNTAAYCMMAGYILKTICHGLLWFYVSRTVIGLSGYR